EASAFGRLGKRRPSLTAQRLREAGDSLRERPAGSALPSRRDPALGNRQSGMGNLPRPTAPPLGIGNREWESGRKTSPHRTPPPFFHRRRRLPAPSFPIPTIAHSR